MRQIIVASVLLGSVASPTLAQPEDVLLDMIDDGIEVMSEDSGLTIGSRERGDDGSLVLRDVVLKPEDNDVTISTDFISFLPSAARPSEVIVKIADAVDIVVEKEGEPPLELLLTSDMFELSTDWVRDMAGSPVVSVAAGAIGIKSETESHPLLKGLDLSLNDLSFRFAFDADTRSFDGAFSAARIGGLYDFIDPEQNLRQSGEIEYSQYQFGFSGENIPKDETGLTAFVDQDGSFSFAGGAGPTTFDITVETPDIPVRLAGSANAGTFEVSLKDGLLSYVANSEGFDYRAETMSPLLPLPPFEISMSGLAMDFRIPVRTSDTTQQLNADLALRDLVVSDSLWGLLDPEETIARDPATLLIDLGAEVVIEKPLVESLNKDGSEDVANPMEIGSVTSVDIATVRLNAGGAEIAASGDLTIDNDGPIPMPEGSIDISLNGLQGLTQALVDLGLIEQQQMGMAMGMLMAFAKPGEAADQFTSTVEFKDGGISANGIPIK
ncbi:DUF2125 domain-containing protein [Algicella marina]|uniref:DUF2125 domain-containing protein n=1 Tax=Algicella marina TaxID=2683284 RepID=A0A6P1T3J2_9RHOB|nr:DUF2125 domain-containing protein [Algicella marina]QHQ36587.1 DUF2125 domain-containing protein [Algicella marina]